MEKNSVVFIKFAIWLQEVATKGLIFKRSNFQKVQYQKVQYQKKY